MHMRLEYMMNPSGVSLLNQALSSSGLFRACTPTLGRRQAPPKHSWDPTVKGENPSRLFPHAVLLEMGISFAQTLARKQTCFSTAYETSTVATANEPGGRQWLSLSAMQPHNLVNCCREARASRVSLLVAFSIARRGHYWCVFEVVCCLLSVRWNLMLGAACMGEGGKSMGSGPQEHKLEIRL